jgi:hypothetical protein
MTTLTDTSIIERLDVRVRVAPGDAEMLREIHVRVFAAGVDLYGEPFLATVGGELGDAAAQLEDDFANNGDMLDDPLAVAFGLTEPEDERSDEYAAFWDERERIENVIATHAVNVARVTIDAIT